MGDSAAKYSKLLVKNAEITKLVRLKGQLVRPKIDKKEARMIMRKQNTWSMAFVLGVSKILTMKMREENRTKMERNNKLKRKILRTKMMEEKRTKMEKLKRKIDIDLTRKIDIDLTYD